jgi:glutamate dehydrogenase
VSIESTIRIVPGDGESRVRLTVYGQPATLSSIVPLLERLGLEVLDERTQEFPPDRWVHDIGVRSDPADAFADLQVRARVEAALRGLWAGDVEADGFNRLVLSAQLRSDQVDVLRSYARYYRQVNPSISQDAFEWALVRNPDVATALCSLFDARFNPTSTQATEPMAVAVTTLLDAVTSLEDDRALRAIVGLVGATVRTNVYRSVRTASAFKFDPSLIADLPLPRPTHEIWVCHASVEGVHLRGGDVARGGIRWSDRRDDFRTEVLGLMKAQMVKNAVIVPVGAKGGFVAKKGSGVDAYKVFINALLDLTDNVVGGVVEHPDGVVFYDGDDAYFVVAADKGTARFSDIANEIAINRGFWLGDAFASGGSDGYDHKKMGITSRGAWESVRRHFRGLGVDADTAPLTVVGVGDMSGDVFGNGLLRSPHVRLVAAFDHRHIFLDPDPDPQVSFAERRRLYDLPASSWADYNPELLSAGGAIWPRSLKSIVLTAAVRARLGVSAEQLTPAELISAILRSPVDLLWNGGIGTYVKASSERNDDVGDRVNDSLRVNGIELRCRVVAEGGNLGFTQLGRIEFALNGGIVNTDAIDNSAGVDCSDHEVNIKIALADAMSNGRLVAHERSSFLASMEADVALAVLDDNHDQNLALAIARRRAIPMIDVHTRYLRTLESEGLIDRQLEYLPSAKALAERSTAGVGLTAPEFAVLLAYTKTTNFAELIATGLADEAALAPLLSGYFPPAMRTRFAHEITNHRLRREITLTAFVNEMVNHSGITFDHRMAEETGASLHDVSRAWFVARNILDLPRWWDSVERLDVASEVQLDILAQLREVVERTTLWLLRHGRAPVDLVQTVAEFAAGVEELASRPEETMIGSVGRTIAATAAQRREQGVPHELASRNAAWPWLHTALDVVELAAARGRSASDTARAYWAVFDELDLSWIWDRVGALPRQTRWEAQARGAVRDHLVGGMRNLCDSVLRSGDSFDAPSVLVATWAVDNRRAVDRTRRVFADIRHEGVFDLITLTVAVRQLHNLANTV